MKKNNEFIKLLDKAVEDKVFPGANLGIIVKTDDGYKRNFFSC